ncbi:MAG: radical SAM protein [Nitrospinota bacterium]
MIKDRIIKFFRCLFNTPSPIPIEAQMEITNKCNFSCNMCPRENMNVPLTNMDFGLFKEVVRKLSHPTYTPPLQGGDAEGVRDFILTGWGEPLLHPDFFEMVDFIKSTNNSARIRFTTNGSLLDKDFRKRILESNINQVSISMDGLDSSNHIDGHVESGRIIENVTALAAERNSNKIPQIVFQSTMHCNNLKGLKNLIELGGRIGIDRINLVRLDARNNKGLKRPSMDEERHIYGELQNIAEKFNIPISFINKQGILLQMAGHFDRLCFRTIDHIYVNVNGDVTPCCNLREMRMGNLTKEDIKEIWNNRIFRNFRAYQLRVCRGCDALKRRHHH